MKRTRHLPRATLVIVLALALAGAGMGQQELSNEPVMTDAEIQKILAERIDEKRQGVGIVVGVIEDRGERIVGHGALNQNDGRPLDGSTTFEIGGLTSVFTALLFADMVQRHEVSLDDPVVRYLPPGTKVPVQGNQQITLSELATHTAGLPLVPLNLHPKNSANPYADYSENDLYQSLASCKISGRLGVDYSYSHVGMALLGLALAKRAGQSYDILLKNRILDPLGMKNTGVSITPDMKARLAVGHDNNLQAVPYWEPGGLVAAVGLKSTAQDLLNFVEAALGYHKTTLAASMGAMLAMRKPTRYPGLELGLGWHFLATDKTQIVWDNGGTGGFRSFMAFSPRTKVGIVVLSNTDGKTGIEDIGLRLFTPTPADLYFLKEHKEVKIDPHVLAAYVGVYQLADGMQLTIALAGDHLTAKLGQQTFDLSAESNKDFFVRNVEGQMTFVTDRDGNSYMLVLHQAGTDLPATRIK